MHGTEKTGKKSLQNSRVEPPAVVRGLRAACQRVHAEDLDEFLGGRPGRSCLLVFLP